MDSIERGGFEALWPRPPDAEGVGPGRLVGELLAELGEADATA